MLQFKSTMLFDKRVFFPHSAEAAPTWKEEKSGILAASEGQNETNEIMSGKKNTPAT